MRVASTTDDQYQPGNPVCLRHFTVRVSRMGCNCNGWPVRDIALMVMVIVEVPEGVITTDGGAGATLVLALLPLPHPLA